MGDVMRADMGKVLVERPRLKRRSGDSRARKGYRKELQRSLVAEAPPNRERLKARYGHNLKFFNENLAPLRRFLQSNVGRPWNKVYAEICQHVDRGNVVQKHVLTHLFDYVAINVILLDGEPCQGGGERQRYGESLRTSYSRHQWYVCPKSGLLRKSRYVRRQSRRYEPPRRVVLNKSKMCLLLNGQWELVTVAPMPGPPQNPSGYDVVRKRKTAGWPPEHANAVKFYGSAVYAVSRRPLSRVELLALPIPIEWMP